MKIKITEEYINLRIDKFISVIEKDFSRSKIQKLIDDNKVKVNGEIVKSSYKVSLDDEVEYELILENKSTMKGEDIDIDVVYEDDDVAVINKPKGMVVHPGAGNYEHTLANALINKFNNLSHINGEFRPGIVHRIDKDTSGLVVVAKNDFSHNYLSNELKDHLISRKYYALVKGEIKENSAVIRAPIGRDKTNRLKMAVDLVNGKDAITHFKVLKRYNGYTFIECELETGRTHQIRVHMNYIGYPIIGDPLYGKNNKDLYKDGQLLHAHEIRFSHPRTKKEVKCEVPLPKYFEEILNNLKEKH